jgi:proton-coupled amino acid transporter
LHSEESRKVFPAVYNRIIIGTIAFYTIFGLSCWISFGPNVRTVLTTSLPGGSLATSVQLAYSLAVMLTFPLQNFPALEIFVRAVKSGVAVDSPPLFMKRDVICSAQVVLLAVVAVYTMD